MLLNVNFNIVLFIMFVLTLCLSICTRMAPPTQHLLYPILEVEYDDEHRAHVLTNTEAEVALPPLRLHTHNRAPSGMSVCAVHMAC
jgi:hypothetical protein